MRNSTGELFSFKISDTERLDVFVSDGWQTILVNMDVWEEGNSTVVSSSSEKYVNFDMHLTEEASENMWKHLINKQSMEVAGVEILQ